MFARALIVLLLILNLGVALWWATREEAVPATSVELPAGAEPLQLLGEAPPPPAGAAARPAETASARASAPVPVASGADGAPPPGAVGSSDPPAVAGSLPAASQCHAFGPFDDAQAAARAATALRPAVLRVATREVRQARGVPRGWDVRLPGLSDRAAAEAMATRLTAAGFRDHYLMPADAAGRVDIALGRFGGEDAARRHRAALEAAGFEAVEAPIGDGGPVRHWVDVAAGPEADLPVLQQAAAATQRERIECDRFAAAGR